MHEFTLIREQQQPARIFIEPTNTGDHGVAFAPTWGE